MNRNLYYVPRHILNRYVYLCLILSFGLLNPLFAQTTYTISGTVANQSGETLPGVNVIIKGDVSHGTSTDIDGKFSLTAPKPEVTLVFSFVGTDTKEMQAFAGVPLSVVLEEKSIGLSELVVVGYGTQKKVL
ncbi:MAG: carboxypeptidase-like regulatory domain-containing protein [Bacteroidales bacterium]|nr:carboxypeptidase-like regulatory domain-containing protein [Bacteroidales bacterium]